MTLVSPGKPARVISENAVCTAGGTEYNIYTCPDNCRAEVTMLMVVNAGGSTTSASVIWYDASKTADVHILGSKSLSAGDYVLFTGATLALEPGDRLDITAGSSGTVHVDAICTVTETFIPIG
jgi:hypothetical protein